MDNEIDDKKLAMCIKSKEINKTEYNDWNLTNKSCRAKAKNNAILKFYENPINHKIILNSQLGHLQIKQEFKQHKKN